MDTAIGGFKTDITKLLRIRFVTFFNQYHGEKFRFGSRPGLRPGQNLWPNVRYADTLPGLGLEFGELKNDNFGLAHESGYGLSFQT